MTLGILLTHLLHLATLTKLNGLKRLITSLILAGIAYAALTWFPPLVMTFLLGIACAIACITEWPKLGRWYYAPFYPIAPFGALMALNHSHPSFLFSLLLISVTCHDMGAYLGGSLAGVTKLCPAITPNKTWEGLLSGVVASYCATVGCCLYHGIALSDTVLIILVLALNSAAVIGDLFESWLKRRAGIKDSGTVLPGHGGILDRFDSILCAGTILYFIKDLLF